MFHTKPAEYYVTSKETVLPEMKINAKIFIMMFAADIHSHKRLTVVYSLLNLKGAYQHKNDAIECYQNSLLT